MRNHFSLLLAAALAASLTVAAPQVAHAQTPLKKAERAPFDDVPVSSWVYEAAADLPDWVYLHPAGYPPRLRRGDKMTPLEFAVLIARIADQVPAQRRIGSDQETSVRVFDRKGITALRRLTEEFTPELTTIGVDVAEVRRRLAIVQDIAPPFREVSPDHWAAASIEKLRKAGILVGYPSRTFNPQP